MSFASPSIIAIGLAVLALAIVLYALARRAGRRRRDTFVAPGLLAAAVPRAPGLRVHAAPVVYAVSAAALVLALAKPQRTVSVPVEQATVVLVTDHSRSMEATDVAPNRLEAARRAASTFLDKVPASLRVGSVVFNQHASLLQVPSTDRAAVRTGLDNLRAFGGTATGEGLALGLAAARGPARQGAKPPPAAIILLTDGRSSNGRDPLAVARDAKAAGIPIHTVALGTASGVLANGKTASADEASLRTIAQLSGGHFSTAADAGQLQSVYRELGSRVATKRVKRDVTTSFVGGGLLLLLAGGALSLLTFGRLP